MFARTCWDIRLLPKASTCWPEFTIRREDPSGVVLISLLVNVPCGRGDLRTAMACLRVLA